jgi:hypothetical protein
MLGGGGTGNGRQSCNRAIVHSCSGAATQRSHLVLMPDIESHTQARKTVSARHTNSPYILRVQMQMQMQICRNTRGSIVAITLSSLLCESVCHSQRANYIAMGETDARWPARKRKRQSLDSGGDAQCGAYCSDKVGKRHSVGWARPSFDNVKH